MEKRVFRVAAICFDHFHVGDLLRMVVNHPQAELVGVYDDSRERVLEVLSGIGLPSHLVMDDVRWLLERSKPDLIILCPAAKRHAEWVEKVASSGAWLLVEKPFAASIEEARRMVLACRSHGSNLVINWPLTWVPSHRTAYRLAVIERQIGDLQSVYYYGGNRGPLWHTFDKIERTSEQVELEKPNSWFYHREQGGGSLLDYLGYGATLGTWFHSGKAPIEVTAMKDEPAGLEVDEHSITLCRYHSGLSRFETRWGTLTDPWHHQTQPACGFTLVGTEGTIQSNDYAKSIRLQTKAHPDGQDIPVDTLSVPFMNPIQYVLHCMANDLEVAGPLSLPISWTGQRIVDAAFRSSVEKRTIALGEDTIFP